MRVLRQFASSTVRNSQFSNILAIPRNIKIQILKYPSLVESTLKSLISRKDTPLYLSLDAEWNIYKRVGVSIIQLAPHSDPDNIYLIPVHRFTTLPPSLEALLRSHLVVKVGSRVAGDLTRLKKQFLQLSDLTNFATIDLKEYAIERGIIGRKESGSLDALVSKTLGMTLPKTETPRMSYQWEMWDLPPSLINYAALDVYASRLVFEALWPLPHALGTVRDSKGPRIVADMV